MRAHGPYISVRVSGVGIKREGLLYLQKYGIGGPEFGITERRISNRKGKAALPYTSMNKRGVLCAAQSLTGVNWNHTYVICFTQEGRHLYQ